MMAKRAFDLLASLLGVMVLAPFMVVIALVVKVDSPGPIIFRQQRVGREGRPFDILKFRSMRTESTGGRQITVGGDSRITASGKVLRKLKLDELPQLFNVIAGDMSIVGPRPEVPRYVEMYPPDVRAVVLSVRPGITDKASVEFRNEEDLLAHSVDPETMYVREILPRKLGLHTAYVKSRSFLGDLVLIGRTIWTVARH